MIVGGQLATMRSHVRYLHLMPLDHTAGPPNKGTPSNAPQWREYADRVRTSLACLPALSWIADQQRSAARLIRVIDQGLAGSAWGQPTRAISALGSAEQRLRVATGGIAAAIERAGRQLARHGQNGVGVSIAGWGAAAAAHAPSAPKATLKDLSQFVAGCRAALQPAALVAAAEQVKLARSQLAAAPRSLPPSALLDTFGMADVQGMLGQALLALEQAAAETDTAETALGQYLTGALGEVTPEPSDKPAKSEKQKRPQRTDASTPRTLPTASGKPSKSLDGATDNSANSAADDTAEPESAPNPATQANPTMGEPRDHPPGADSPAAESP